VNALAFPALGVLLLTMLLAYSRGALLAAGVGAAFWFVLVPVRLRGFAVLATSLAGAGLVAAWAFAQDGLTEDKIDVGLRASAGHQLGVALVAMIAALLMAGFAVGFATARWPLRAGRRRRAGKLILTGLALVPVVVVGVLALSDRGLSGSVSHGWNQLTNPHAITPPNEPGRLTAVGSVRARYWNEALKIFKARPLLGAGAGGYATARPQFREDTLDVRHAHGYVVQTLADLGLVGLAVSLALLAAWLAAAIRTTGLQGAARRAPYGPERIGLLTLCAVVVVFGVHSFVDWTWFVPGTVLPALLCAGWVAGRGPVLEGGGPGVPSWPERAAVRRGDPRLAAAVAVAVVALASAWATYQPLRSVHAGDDALAELEAGRIAAARRAALDAHDINPVSIEPLFDLSVIEAQAGHPMAARAALDKAATLQPSNADPWLRLAELDFAAGNLQAALADLGPALHLDPRSPVGVQMFLEINRRLAGSATP
jgi:O-antigen ligase